MARSNLALLLALLFFFAKDISAQVNRYVVYFPDKKDSPYSVEQPGDYLSQKAIDRRVKSGYQITEEDFPVNPNYLDSLVKYNAKPYYTSRWFNAAIVQVDQGIIDELDGKSFVAGLEYVAPGIQYSENPSAPNTSYVANEPSGSDTSAPQLNMILVNSMHDDGYTGEGLWVAVLDAGFSGANESAVFKDLFEEGRIIDTEDFVSRGKDVFKYVDHGTKVLSCLAANYNDQVVGTGYGVNVSLYVTGDDVQFSDEFRIEEFNWVLAAEKADSAGVDIISSSLGYNTFEDPSMDYTTAQLDGKTAIVTIGAEKASERGILVVSSAGNSGNDPWELVTFPADGSNVLSVGGVDLSKNRSSFSSLGPTADNRIKPDVSALATGTVVVSGSGSIVQSNGTSFSCPLITGLAAGLWQAMPELTNLELKDLIINSASQANNPDNSLGYGIPNYNVAVGKVLSVRQENPANFSIFPNPVSGDRVQLKSSAMSEYQDMVIQIYNTYGMVVVSEQRHGANLSEGIEIDLTGLTKGLYILSIIGQGNYNGIKLLKF